MPDDNDDARVEEILHSKPIFEARYQRKDSGETVKDQFQTTFLQRLDDTLSKIRPIDLFGAATKPLTDEAARNLLQGDEFIREFSWIQASLEVPHALNGEIRQKSEEILSIAKTLFKDNEIFKNWKSDINRRKAKDAHSGSWKRELHS